MCFTEFTTSIFVPPSRPDAVEALTWEELADVSVAYASLRLFSQSLFGAALRGWDATAVRPVALMSIGAVEERKFQSALAQDLDFVASIPGRSLAIFDSRTSAICGRWLTNIYRQMTVDNASP